MKINIYIISLLLSVVLIGCDDFRLGDSFLEKRTSTDIPLDEVFSKRIYAEQVLAEAYRSLPDGLPQENRLSYGGLESITDLSTCEKSGGGLSQYAGNQLSPASDLSRTAYRLDDSNKRGPMSGIWTAYRFIENVDKVPDMTNEEKQIRKAEAKVIIAFHYSQMLRYYGGMPWISHAYGPSDNFKTVRMTVEQHVDSTVNLLDQAIKVLPWTFSESEDGRMTKAGAMALKIRVLLFAASPIFNANEPYCPGIAADQKIVWYGDYQQSRWQRALNAGLDFMDSVRVNGFYKLVSTGNPRSDFQAGYFNRRNGEVLLSSRWFTTYQTNLWPFGEILYGQLNPTLNLVDMFPMADGSEFSWDNPVHAANPFFNSSGNMVRDVRLYETCIVDGDDYQGRKAEVYVGGRENKNSGLVRSGFGMRKFYQDQKSNIGKFYQWPLMRLPEVYLSIAEALNEMGRTNEAYEYIKLIRDRVGLPNVTAGMNQSEMREAILKERCLELAFEEVRFFDLIRWKRSDIFKSTFRKRGLTITKDAVTGKLTYTQKQVTLAMLWAEQWKDANFLHPIPVSEMNKKYGLVQNPGW